MGWNADIDNEEINKKTDKITILYQASVFNKYCRVFAPRYRQANLLAFFTDDKVKSTASFNIAYEDIKAAFEFYFSNLLVRSGLALNGQSGEFLHIETGQRCCYFTRTCLGNQDHRLM